MKKRSFIFILWCLVVGFLSSCKEEVYSVDQENDAPIGCVGEVNNRSARVGIYRAGNLTQGKTFEPIEGAAVTLSDAHGTRYPLAWSHGTYQLEAFSLKIKPHVPYTLHSTWGDKTYRATIELPDSFAMEWRYTYPDITLSVGSIEGSNTPFQSVIELYKQETDGTLTPLSFTSSDTETDNFIYNELDEPYRKLFIKQTIKQAGEPCRLSLKLANASESDCCYLVVRSVPSSYYTFLYLSEVQKNSEQGAFVLPSNIQGGAIGFIGSAFYQQIKLTPR